MLRCPNAPWFLCHCVPFPGGDKLFTVLVTSSIRRIITIKIEDRVAANWALSKNSPDDTFTQFKDILGAADIKFHPTITILIPVYKPTEFCKLHLDVYEDLNEIFEFPEIPSVVQTQRQYTDGDLTHVSHIGGYFFKVKADERTFILRELGVREDIVGILGEIESLNSSSPGEALPNWVTPCPPDSGIEGVVITGEIRLKGYLIPCVL